VNILEKRIGGSFRLKRVHFSVKGSIRFSSVLK